MRAPIALALLLVVGCAKGPELEPAPGARGTQDEARMSDAGVTVVVDPDVWMGLALDEPDLVQLHLDIDNDSGRTLLLRPEHIQLVAPDGRSWTAIDPDRPDMVDLDLRDELFERGAGERVIQDVADENLDGHVYFRGVDPRVSQLELRVELVDYDTGEQFGSIEVPFVVADANEPAVSQRPAGS